MKNLLLLFVWLFSFFSITFAQITITDGVGTPINNGDTRIFNTDGDEANLVTLITNNASSQIELRLKAVSITGAHGAGMEFCIGACYFGMTAGTVYPSGTTHYYLDAGVISGENDIHFHHHIQTGDPDVTEYVLKIYEDGNEANNFVQFTYKYDANYTGINDINRNNIVSIFPNPASNFFKINIPESSINSELIISNILGKTVLKSQLNVSETKIDTRNYASGIYFVSVLSEGKIIDTKKLIIK